jgi:hypothetical protein
MNAHIKITIENQWFKITECKLHYIIEFLHKSMYSKKKIKKIKSGFYNIYFVLVMPTIALIARIIAAGATNAAILFKIALIIVPKGAST